MSRSVRLAALLALATASTLAAQTRRDSVRIRQLDSTWARVYATHDTATALQLYSANLVFTSANGARKTREQELNDVRPAESLVMHYFRTTPREIVVRDNRATVSGSAEWQFTMNASQRTVRRGYVIEYARGGPLDWQIVAVTMSTP